MIQFADFSFKGEISELFVVRHIGGISLVKYLAGLNRYPKKEFLVGTSWFAKKFDCLNKSLKEFMCRRVLMQASNVAFVELSIFYDWGMISCRLKYIYGMGKFLKNNPDS